MLPNITPCQAKPTHTITQNHFTPSNVTNYLPVLPYTTPSQHPISPNNTPHWHSIPTNVAQHRPISPHTTTCHHPKPCYHSRLFKVWNYMCMCFGISVFGMYPPWSNKSVNCWVIKCGHGGVSADQRFSVFLITPARASTKNNCVNNPGSINETRTCTA